jgi:hypothetical protein
MAKTATFHFIIFWYLKMLGNNNCFSATDKPYTYCSLSLPLCIPNILKMSTRTFGQSFRIFCFSLKSTHTFQSALPSSLSLRARSDLGELHRVSASESTSNEIQLTSSESLSLHASLTRLTTLIFVPVHSAQVHCLYPRAVINLIPAVSH